MKFPKVCKIWYALAKARTRYAIDMAYLSVKKRLLWATDGVIMACVPVEVDEGDSDILIPAEALRLAAKSTIVGRVFDEPKTDAKHPAELPNATDILRKSLSGSQFIGLDVKLLNKLAWALGSSKVVLILPSEMTVHRLANDPQGDLAFGVVVCDTKAVGCIMLRSVDTKAVLSSIHNIVGRLKEDDKKPVKKKVVKRKVKKHAASHR